MRQMPLRVADDLGEKIDRACEVTGQAREQWLRGAVEHYLACPNVGTITSRPGALRGRSSADVKADVKPIPKGKL